MDINADLLHCFINFLNEFLDKNSSATSGPPGIFAMQNKFAGSSVTIETKN